MTTLPTPSDALRDAVDQTGSQLNFARLVGVGQPAVSKWVRLGKPLPAEHVLKVEQSTGVSRHLLRPDIYPAADTVPATPGYPDQPTAVRSNDTLSFDQGDRS